jgi:hypothetical protein
MPVLEKEEINVSRAGQTTVPGEEKLPENFEFFEAVPIQLPREILFAASVDQRLRFTRPLAVRLYREGDLYVAYSPDLEEFGTGDNLSLSLDDLSKTIAESFFSLEEMKERLGSDLQRQLGRLREFVEVRRPT